MEIDWIDGMFCNPDGGPHLADPRFMAASGSTTFGSLSACEVIRNMRELKAKIDRRIVLITHPDNEALLRGRLGYVCRKLNEQSVKEAKLKPCIEYYLPDLADVDSVWEIRTDDGIPPYESDGQILVREFNTGKLCLYSTLKSGDEL